MAAQEKHSSIQLHELLFIKQQHILPGTCGACSTHSQTMWGDDKEIILLGKFSEILCLWRADANSAGVLEMKIAVGEGTLNSYFECVNSHHLVSAVPEKTNVRPVTKSPAMYNVCENCDKKSMFIPCGSLEEWLLNHASSSNIQTEMCTSHSHPPSPPGLIKQINMWKLNYSLKKDS